MGISKKKVDQYHKDFKKMHVRIPWRYYQYVLRKKFGFEMDRAGKTSGAKRAFVKGSIRFTADEPHKGKDDIVDKTSRENAISAIEKLEVIKEKGD